MCIDARQDRHRLPAFIKTPLFCECLGLPVASQGRNEGDYVPVCDQDVRLLREDLM